MTVAIPLFKYGAEGEIYNVQYGDVWVPPTTGFEANQTRVPLGTLVKMYDKELGMGEFIFLAGAASMAIGNIVTWESTVTTGAPPTWQTTRHVASAISGKTIAVATSAVTTTTSYGWFQLTGFCQMLSNGTISGANAVIDTVGTGTVTTTVTAGMQLLNARCVSALGVPSGNLIIALINRPCTQGAIT